MSVLPLLGVFLLAQSPDSLPTAPLPGSVSSESTFAEVPSRPWTIQLTLRNGIEWGDLRKAEQDMANEVNLVVEDQFGNQSEPFILLNPIGFELSLWRKLDPELEVGLAGRWSIVMAKMSGGSEPLLRSISGFAKARWLPVRNQYSNLGLHAGFGAMRGTLTRYPFLQDATPNPEMPPDMVEENRFWFSLAHEDVELSGFGGEIGPALEFPITPAISVGGAVLFTWDTWTMTESDPIAVTNIDYPQSPSDQSITLDIHVAAHF